MNVGGTENPGNTLFQLTIDGESMLSTIDRFVESNDSEVVADVIAWMRHAVPGEAHAFDDGQGMFRAVRS